MSLTDAERMRDLLQPLVTDPDVYWHTVVMLAAQDLGVLAEVHRQECAREPGTCRTCAELERAWAMFDAHDLIQPSGCGCPDHIIYPRRVARQPGAAA
jgi:hypothetical protein